MTRPEGADLVSKPLREEIDLVQIIYVTGRVFAPTCNTGCQSLS
ncbi:hypothetical protein FHW03_004269 [Ochrobactrum sp. RH2CCR150]|nr:hypothetical protein [Ochrobactrum sp. RH2CCR150]